ncbi:MAG: ATP-grasp domain-containing protein [Spirosomaceae bacterium]|jgi:D-alanine-D-alanine ligase|nr:ATP-grasp domain-containing protein [Spirosomataceae bacterium]
MKLLYLYSESDFTPWRENINAQTMAALIQATPAFCTPSVAHFVGFTPEFADFLRQFDLVFNVCYGYGVADQVEVVRWLDWHDIKHTASSYETQLLAMDKALLPDLCAQVGLDTPAILTIEQAALFSSNATFIAKHRYGSLHRDMLFFRRDEMPYAMLEQQKDYLIQPYIEGREFTVAVIPDADGARPVCLPPLEIIPDDGRTIYVAGQSYGKTFKEFYPVMDKTFRQKMMKGILDLHKLLGIKGMSRTDLRVAEDKIYVLDINTMPNLDPQRSYLPALVRNYGLSMTDLVARLAQSATHWYQQRQVPHESMSAIGE